FKKSFRAVKIFLYEDLQEDPKKLLNDICDFVGAGKYHWNTDKVHNRGRTKKVPKSAMASQAIKLGRRFKSFVPAGLRKSLRENLVKEKELHIEPEAINHLKSVFREDILSLQSIIDRDLSGWLTKL
ncbi:MAG: sulfotransferase domain-containing protein, partial [Bacteroidota bacterium]